MGLTSSSEHKHTLLIRPIEITDINEQYFDLLSGLYSNCKNFLQAETFFHSLDAHHHIIVVENPTNHLLVGSGTIFIEPKIIHNFGFVGHIEDIVLRPNAIDSLATSFEVYRIEEITISNKAINRKLVKEVAFPPTGSLVIQKRGGEVFIPHGNTHLLLGDQLTVIGTGAALAEFRNILEGR